MTLGNCGGCTCGLIVWCLPFGEPRLRRASRLRREPHGFAGCRDCRHQVEPATASLRAAEGGTSADPAAKLLTEPSQMASPAEMARRYGPQTPVPDWRERLVCSRCGSRRRRLSLRERHDVDMVVTGERCCSVYPAIGIKKSRPAISPAINPALSPKSASLCTDTDRKPPPRGSSQHNVPWFE
jgi:hypothetical protein